MKGSKEKRTKWITIRVSENEYQQVENSSRQTTCRHLSEYTRKMVLGKPIVYHYHNKSLESFVEEMVALRRTLEDLVKNYNQVVIRLSSLRHLPELGHWLIDNEVDKDQISRQIKIISETIANSYKLWSHE